jgi:hypothetical protein
MASYKKNPPQANVLMNSMRSMGYSFESAIADILDNSISAQAHSIRINFPTEPSYCYVSILDDGLGMSNDDLFNAMKYGSITDENKRSENDLGRFGLGLKSASLSQCKRLTVISKINRDVSAYVWDLDIIEDQRDWTIQELNQLEISDLPNIDTLLNQKTGTLVIWQNFDIIEKSSGDIFTTLDSYKEKTANYISLIFHRFLNDDKDKRIEIFVNNHSLTGLDPFLEEHKKTNHRREFYIPIKDSKGTERYIRVKPYVLPFQKDMTKEDFKKIGGVENYKVKQGFYIYRNKRLIVWGTWFGLPKSELTKNARVKVDIPNTLDDIWSLDIKKQNATIPRLIKNHLKSAVEEAMNISIKSQEYRGRIKNIDDHLDYIWQIVECRDGKSVYKINRESKIFQLLKDEEIADSIISKFDMILEEIENSIPYHQIYIDMSKNQIFDEIEDERIKNIENKARILIDLSKKMGNKSIIDVIDVLFNSEPFCKFPNMKIKLLEEYTVGN